MTGQLRNSLPRFWTDIPMYEATVRTVYFVQTDNGAVKKMGVLIGQVRWGVHALTDLIPERPRSPYCTMHLIITSRSMTPVVFLGFRQRASINTLHQRYTMPFAHNVHQERPKEENGHTLKTIPWFSIGYGAKITP